VNREKGALDPEVEVLLERGRIIRPAPDVVRVRALARARAAVASATEQPDVQATSAAPERSHRLRFAVAASLGLIAGAAGAAAAFFNHARDIPEAAVSPTHHVATPARTPVDPAPLPPAPLPAASPLPPPARIAKAARQLTPQESYAAELDLLHRAQAAHASRRFAGALALVAEHGRRFPNGRLAEEREALRVRSLAASDRTEEARRAAAAFAQRFPRSVLLPRLLKSANGAEK
jgi:hypothetical protein